MNRYGKFWGIMAIVILVLVGCSSTDNTSPTTSESPTLATEVTEIPSTGEVTQETIVSDKLLGMELIKSLNYKVPSKVYLKGTTKTEGLTITMTMYLEGENLRYETSGFEGDQVMIYDAKKGITYVYNLNENMGFMIPDEEESDSDDVEYEEDFGMGDGLPLFDENPFEDIEDTLLAAELTTFKGYDVVYYETKMISEEGEYITKNWISTEFWYPLKSETLFNGTTIYSYEIDEIGDKYPGPGKPFEVPEDIEFMDFSNIFG